MSDTKIEFNIIKEEQTPEAHHAVTFADEGLCIAFMNYATGLHNCAGLAANQLSVDGQRLRHRMFMMKNRGIPVLCLNPSILRREGRITKYAEKCLTWGDRSLAAERYETLYVQYYDHNGGGRWIKKHLRGKEAQIFQHEMDHIDGIEEKFLDEEKEK